MSVNDIDAVRKWLVFCESCPYICFMKDDIFYIAMLARDYRFDGRFFVGVKTTGIYCRPICPAKPKRENVEFFQSASAAEKAGYRPCLRCRPECAPLSPAWNGQSAIVQRALRVIAADGFFESNEDEFAEKFGVTARHLRRVFVEELGLTPKQIAFNNRLGFARKLVVETQLSMTDVGLTAGFLSLRRFNDAFKKRFHREPRALRKIKKIVDEGVVLSLAYRPPLDWPSLLAFFRSHQIAGAENVTDDAYERVFRLNNSVGFLRVTHDKTTPRLKVQILIDNPTLLFAVTQKVRQMFDLDSDPLLVANTFQSHQFLDSLAKKYPGLRLAKGWDAFETAIVTLLGQLVSLVQARNLVAQLVQNYGERVMHPVTGAEAYIFPTAQAIAKSDLLLVKTTQARRNAIRELAKRVVSGVIDLTRPQDPEVLREQLLAIAGVGPWSYEYIHLRAVGSADAFPATDLILKRALEKHRDLNLETLRPWRSYAAIYLWRHYAQQLSKTKARLK